MRCCFCNRQIMQNEIEQGNAHILMTIPSHVACDDEQLERQEKPKLVYSAPRQPSLSNYHGMKTMSNPYNYDEDEDKEEELYDFTEMRRTKW